MLIVYRNIIYSKYGDVKDFKYGHIIYSQYGYWLNYKYGQCKATKKLKICGYQNIVYYYGYSKYGLVKYFHCGHSMVS